MWRILEFLIYEKLLLVKQLAIYISEEQYIYYKKHIIAKKLYKKINSVQ